MCVYILVKILRIKDLSCKVIAIIEFSVKKIKVRFTLVSLTPFFFVFIQLELPSMGIFLLMYSSPGPYFGHFVGQHILLKAFTSQFEY